MTSCDMTILWTRTFWCNIDVKMFC